MTMKKHLDRSTAAVVLAILSSTVFVTVATKQFQVGLLPLSIRNFIPSNNNVTPTPPKQNQQDEGCSILPKIDIIDSEADAELRYLEPNVVFAPQPAHIVVQCTSSSPIEWTFDGPYHPLVSSIQVFYNFSSGATSIENDSSEKSCFQIKVKLETGKTSTGKYWCRTVDKTQVTSWYLYGDGNRPPSLLYQGNEFDIILNGSHPVILPCQVVNPNLRPRLTRGDSGIIEIDNSVSFDPQIGFTLDLEKIPDPYGKYQCSVDDNPVTFNIQKPSDYIVTPSSATITVVAEHTVKLVCEGVRPVGLQGYIVDSKIKFLSYQENSVFKYKVQYEYYGEKNSQEQVFCVDLKTKTVHHTWNMKVIDEETSKESGISYDPRTRNFICKSTTKDPPAMAIGQCSSPLECLLMYKCLSWDVPFKRARIRTEDVACSTKKILRGAGCSEELEVSENVGCTSVKNHGFSGVVHCTMTELNWSSVLYYFNGLESGTELVITDWTQAPVEELVQVKTPSADNATELYVGQAVEFTCEATKFLFSAGFKWKFMLRNGSLLEPEGSKTSYINGSNSYSEKRTLLIANKDVEYVICLTHFWNSSEWLNVSMKLQVAESFKPKILVPHGDEPLLFTSGSNQSLTCEAEGIPAPTVLWYRKGKIVGSQSQFVKDELKNITASTLNFGHANIDQEGEYECIATNEGGNMTRKVSISIANNNPAVYTGIAIGSFMFVFFIVIVGILWWKLRLNKQLIKKLTPKEYERFRKGDKKAMLNAPDGYIRAQFMPYDDDYEIPEENLEIDKDSILGTGEYGIVHKGTLRQNNREEEVAVKTIRSDGDNSHLKALMSELKILTYIGWHDNVINLLGAVTRHLRERDVYIVVEYCRLGSLENYLRDNKAFYLNQIVDDKLDLNLTYNTSAAALQAYQPFQFTMSTTDLINWSYQISSGMEYLASKKIIHGDLAARNLLLNQHKTVKITDFGLSKHLYDDCSNYVWRSAGPLPWKWLAPETLQYQKFSTHSDVWAFAITLWEIFSLGESPYPGISYNLDFKYKLLQGFRMDRPENANTCIWNVIQQSWATIPLERPCFSDLRRYFHWLLHHWDDPRGPPKLINDDVRYINPNDLNHISFED